MSYLAENITVETTEVKFNINVETQAAGAAQAAAYQAKQEANRAEKAMAGKLDSDKNPALLKFNYIGGSETNDPVLARSVDGWDQSIREIGNVLILSDGRKVMVYTGYTGTYALSYVGIAISEDGGPFVKSGPNGDGQLLFTPSEDPYLIEKDGAFYLYVEKKESGSTHLDIQLFTANSIEDLLIGNVVDHGVILERGDSESWESLDVSSPTVLLKDGVFILLYEGRAISGNSGALGIAFSNDGINFEKYPNNPVASGTQMHGDLQWADHLVPDDIVYQNGLYFLTVHARNGSTYAGGLMVSSDLIKWRDYIGTWITREDGNDNFGSGLMLFYDPDLKQYIAVYVNQVGIMKGYLTFSAKSTQSAQGPFVEKDGNVGLGTTSPQRKMEIAGPKNTSIIRLTSTTNDSGWAYGDIYGAIEFFSRDASSVGASVLAEIKVIDEVRTSSGNWPRIVFSISDPTGGVGLRDVIHIRKEGDLVPVEDGILRLGLSSNRWSTIYATTGTINTSDANEKTEVEDITDIERGVALSIRRKIKKFRFKDAVQQKRTDARIHFGVIAQEVEAEFVHHGLDPRRYGLFCEDFWYTKEVDSEGKMITVEADKEDPEAVEHVRLGIRYDELLAFIISAL
jgi:hypothetical protein